MTALIRLLLLLGLTHATAAVANITCLRIHNASGLSDSFADTPDAVVVVTSAAGDELCKTPVSESASPRWDYDCCFDRQPAASVLAVTLVDVNYVSDTQLGAAELDPAAMTTEGLPVDLGGGVTLRVSLSASSELNCTAAACHTAEGLLPSASLYERMMAYEWETSPPPFAIANESFYTTALERLASYNITSPFAQHEPLFPDEYHAAWFTRWSRLVGISFAASANTGTARTAIFSATVDRLVALKARLKGAGTNLELELNWFAAFTQAEFAALFTGFDASAAANETGGLRVRRRRRLATAAAIDWRNPSMNPKSIVAVAGVKNQGSCGSW